MKAKAISHQEIKLQEKRPLPDGWRWVRLREICDEDRKTVEFNSEISKKRPYISLEHVESDTGRILKIIDKSIENEGKSTTFAFDERHVLYGKLRPYLNKVALPDFEGRCTTELIPILPKSETNREFLAWLLRRTETVEAAMQGKTGSRMPRANLGELLNLEVPYTSHSEQQRIVAILDARMATVERARAAAEAQLEAARALPSAYLRAVFDSPEAQKWPKKKLRRISRLVSGSTPPRGNPENFIGTIPWVKTLDLNFGAVQRTEEFISESAFRQIRGELLPVGTVMVAMYGGKGTIGKSGILGLQATTNQAICSIRPNSDFFVPEFLHYWLIFIRPEWMKYSGGNRKDPNINKKIVEEMKFPRPPVPLQKCIVADLIEKMNIAKSIRQSLEEQLDAINNIPAALLRQAFNGDL